MAPEPSASAPIPVSASMFPAVTGGWQSLLPVAALLAVVIAAVFYPCLVAGYINWDDLAIVRDNPNVSSFSLHSLNNIFSSYNVGHYQPLTTLSFLAEHVIFGGGAKVSHALNIAFHILNSFLAYLVAFCFLKDRRKALLAALIFAVHPMHVESVAWVSERKDMMYSVFYMWAIICYARRSGEGPYENYMPLLGLFTLALLAKSMAITLPLVLLLMDFLKEGRITKDRFVEKGPLLAIACLFAHMAVISQGKAGFVRSYSLHKIFDGMCIACGNLIFYVWRFVIPVGMSPFYPYPGRGIYDVPPIYCFAPLLFVPLAWAAWKFASRKKLYIVGLLFFLATIAPGLQFIPSGRGLAGDHFTYIPYLGLIFILADIALNNYDALAVAGRRALTAVMAVLLLALGVESHAYCYVWKDSVTVWTHVLSLSPMTPLAYNNRGVAEYRIGMIDKAVADLRLAVIADPKSARFMSNYGTMLVAQRKMPLAVHYYKIAVAMDPKNLEYLNNLGSCYYILGDLDLAEEEFKLAVEASYDDDLSVKHLNYVHKKILEMRRTGEHKS